MPPTLRLRGRRAGASRAILTMADQCVASASNFAVGIVVARLAGAHGLGVFSVAYAFWLILASLHRALVTDPMAIEGDGLGEQARPRIRRGLAAELVLGAAASLACFAAGNLLEAAGVTAYGQALVGLTPWLIVLLVQDYWRWVGFMTGRPGRSLANDVLFTLVQAAAFGALVGTGIPRSPSIVIGSWGLGALAGAALGLWQYGVAPTVRGGWSLLAHRWPMSRWLVGTDVAGTGATQGWLLVAGALLGPAALGGLKAAHTLVTGPSFVLLQAGGSVGLPEASRAYLERGEAALRRVAVALSALSFAGVGVVAVAVFAAGGRLLALLYGPRFAGEQVTASLLAVGYLVIAALFGPILVLKVRRQTRALCVAQLVNMLTVNVLVGCFVVLFGKGGAAVAVICGSVSMGAAMLVLLRHRAPTRDVPPPSAASAVPVQEVRTGQPVTAANVSVSHRLGALSD